MLGSNMPPDGASVTRFELAVGTTEGLLPRVGAHVTGHMPAAREGLEAYRTGEGRRSGVIRTYGNVCRTKISGNMAS